MSATHRFFGVLLIAVAAGALASAQPMPPAESRGAGGLPRSASELLPEPETTYPATRWLRRDSVMNAGRNDGPIGQEISLFTGPSIPVGGGVMSGQLTAGWMLDVRANAVAFMNDDRSAAWLIHYGLGYIYDWQSSAAPIFNLFQLPVRLEELHRFYVALGGGREWFIYDGSLSGQPGTNFRFGIDTGGRWGSMRANLRTTFPVPAANFIHRHDVTGTVYWGAHLNYEVNMGAWTWFGGFRSEYAFTFSDILPGSNSNLQDLNLLLTTGFRY